MTELAETKHYSAHPAMFRNNPLGFALAVVLCFVLVGFVILFVWWLQCQATTLTVTQERTILRKGLLSKSTTEVWHEDVRNVQISQGLLQRLLGVGTVGISSAGQSGVEILAVGIPEPENVRRIIDRYKREN
jgi:uncharacterized membrane protein YdbT with pleckstrin-like domain